MYLDLEDYRPDTPRVPTVMTLREAVLLSLLLHSLAVIAYLVMPDFRSQVNAALLPTERPPLEYVQIVPRTEFKAAPKPNAKASDLDRRAASPLVAPAPQNDDPYSRGNTPEKTVGAPLEKPAGPDRPMTAPPSSAVVPDIASAMAAAATPAVARPAGGGLGASLRNLQQFLQDQNYDNPQGGQPDQNADIQFDSKGVEFGPWLRRFVAQVKRNWFVPESAMFQRGRVVIQFYVLKNGTITDLKVVGASPIEVFNLSALNSLKLSNPTMPLPPEYPDDRAFFTVTFHYNDR
jgi:TonB family protein